jgi:hypothetical protein
MAGDEPITPGNRVLPRFFDFPESDPKLAIGSIGLSLSQTDGEVVRQSNV